MNNYIEQFQQSFQNGKISFQINESLKLSRFVVSEGNFICGSCKCLFKKNDEVLPVFWNNKITNFVCNKDRGLLKILL